MKQLLLRKGTVLVEDVPAPALHPRSILVEVSKSLISTGTEMASVQLSGASLLTKARERPQEVAKVLQSIRVRGLKKTLALVQSKLDEWKPLGYSCTGTVLATGRDVRRFQPGDRVACAGAGIANHAEIVSVPANLAVKVPTAVSDRSAAFVTIGAIALQGVRRADVRLGETVCVIGLGLIGQITVQLLVSAGCQVVGIDLDPARVSRARSLGAKAGGRYEEIKRDLSELTGGMGADATIITASTSSSEPTHQAFDLTRKKGRIVIVGAVGMELQRSPFYEKEQDFLISCSYGPGRYDATYEQEGQDYPYPYVRWTENRNMSAFLSLIADGRVGVDDLVEKEFPISEATAAYDTLSNAGPRPLAVLLDFPPAPAASAKTATAAAITVGRTKTSGIANGSGKVRIGLIGAGNFVKTTHLPNLRSLAPKAEVVAVCTANSASAVTAGKQWGASLVSTDYRDLLMSPDVDAVVVSTRHDTHARIAMDALKAGKHIYLEKPLALEAAEVDAIESVIAGLSTPPVFMVGFNRRFAPSTRKLAAALKDRSGPALATFVVNAGELPAGHWTQGREGGGRLRGEACHMIDFFQALFGRIRSMAISPVHGGGATKPDENFSASFTYADGSVATLIYSAVGHPALPKERVEVHWAGKIAVIDDFKSLTIHGLSGRNLSGIQDKGHLTAMETFLDAIRANRPFPIAWDDLAETTRAAIELDREIWSATL